MPSLQSQAETARLHLKRAFDDARSKASRNGRKDHKGLRPKTFPMERNTAVLWGLYHGWSDDEIGRYFYINKSTVRRRRKLLDETPQDVFLIPVLHKDLVGTRQVFRCEACGSRMGGTERKARTHVVAHFGIGKESIREAGIMDEDRIY